MQPRATRGRCEPGGRRAVTITSEPPEERAGYPARVDPAAPLSGLGARQQRCCERSRRAKEGGTAGPDPAPRPSADDRSPDRRASSTTEDEWRMTGGYRQMPPQVDLPALEHEVLARWRDRDVFARSLGADRRPPALDVLRGPADRERPARHPPRRGAGLQGPVSRATRRCAATTSRAGPAGTATACRSSWRSRSELGFSGKQDIEAYGIAEFNAKCRESVLEHVDEFARMTERMGYWVDLDAAYWTMDSRLHRERLVVAEDDLRQGPAGPGLPGRAVLPAVRHRPVRPRGRAGLPRRDRPVGLRPVPGHERSAGRARCRPAGLDDHARGR